MKNKFYLKNKIAAFYNTHMSKAAFTLAEVLITLGIIGVAAALTMPSLVAKYQEKQTIVKLKKFYSVMDNAFRMAIAENGTVDQWEGTDERGKEKVIFEKISPYLKIAEDCGFEPGCWTKGKLYLLDGTVELADEDAYYNTDREYKAMLTDGSKFMIYVNNKDCSGELSGDNKFNKNSCGDIKVLVNNKKGDYVKGKDVFWFVVSKYGILPTGTADMPYGNHSFYSTCNNRNGGNGCTAWVIFNENMDYLHCDNLTWDGKTKCK